MHHVLTLAILLALIVFIFILAGWVVAVIATLAVLLAFIATVESVIRLLDESPRKD